MSPSPGFGRLLVCSDSQLQLNVDRTLSQLIQNSRMTSLDWSSSSVSSGFHPETHLQHVGLLYVTPPRRGGLKVAVWSFNA